MERSMRLTLAAGLTSIAFIAACAASAGPGDPGGGGTGSSGGSELMSSGSSGSTSSSGTSGSSGSTSSSGTSGSSGSSGTSGSSGSSGSKGSSGSGSTSGAGSSSGGITDASASSSGTGSKGDGTGGSPSSQYLPKISGTCPTITPGANGTSLTFAGEPVTIWAGKPSADQHGSLVLFWFETGGSANDVTFQFGTAQIQAVTAAGGVVASFAKSKGTGTNTGDLVWYTDDFLTADQVVACAIDQMHIDTRRIYTTGASAGALQAAWMAYSRSGYIAAAAPISGGISFAQPLQDPS